MSKLSPASRLAVCAHAKTSVPSGKTTSRNSTSSRVIRAVNGAIGAKRRTSSTAGAASSSGASAERAPLVGVLGEEQQRVRELGLRRVDAADEHRADDVQALLVGETVALLLRGEERREQVVRSAPAAPRVHQPARVLLELVAARSSAGSSLRSLIGSNWPWIVFAHVPEPLGVLERRAHDRRDHPRGVRLGERRDRVAAAVGGHGLVQLGDLLAHRRAQRVGGGRRERGLDELAQPAVVLAVEVEEVPLQPLVQRALGHALHLEDRAARERRLLVRRKNAVASWSSTNQPNGSARAIHVCSRRSRSVSCEPRARERRVHVVERGDVEVGDRGHEPEV